MLESTVFTNFSVFMKSPSGAQRALRDRLSWLKAHVGFAFFGKCEKLFKNEDNLEKGGLNMKSGKDVETKMMTMLGPAAFYIGLLIAVIAMFITPSGWLYVALGILGVIIGLLNITAEESEPFLFATIAFIVAALGMQSLITTAGVTVPKELTRLAANITVLVGAAAIIIALRAIYETAKCK
jgi:hypothetical protein